jgi:hypothetical protein
MPVLMLAGDCVSSRRERRGLAHFRRSTIIALVMVEVEAGMSMRARGMPVRPSGIAVAELETPEMTSK